MEVWRLGADAGVVHSDSAWLEAFPCINNSIRRACDGGLICWLCEGNCVTRFTASLRHVYVDAVFSCSDNGALF